MSIKSLRLKSLMQSYSTLYKSTEGYKDMNITKQMRLLVNSPAPSFFLSESYVRKIIFNYERGVFLKKSLGRQLQEEVYQTFLRLKSQHPSCLKEHIIEMVCSQPASRYFISYRTAARILFWPQKKKNK